MTEVFAWLIVIAALIIAMLGPQYFIARSARGVIADMKARNAIGIDNAVSREELGLTEAPFLKRMTSVRNYRPKALMLLLKLNVVKFDEEGRVYLDAEELAKAGL